MNKIKEYVFKKTQETKFQENSKLIIFYKSRGKLLRFFVGIFAIPGLFIFVMMFQTIIKFGNGGAIYFIFGPIDNSNQWTNLITHLGIEVIIVLALWYFASIFSDKDDEYKKLLEKTKQITSNKMDKEVIKSFYNKKIYLYNFLNYSLILFVLFFLINIFYQVFFNFTVFETLTQKIDNVLVSIFPVIFFLILIVIIFFSISSVLNSKKNKYKKLLKELT